MWTFRSALFLVLAAAVLVDCYPGDRTTESGEDDQEDVSVPSIPAVVVPSGPGFGYLPNFYGFFPDFDLIARIRALVTRLRTQIGDSFSDFDWSRGNTTSTTKVIEGHVVTVNETSIQDDDSDLVLHVRVIDVRPTDGADDSSENSSQTEETTTPKTETATAKTETITPKTTDNAGDRSSSTTSSEEQLGNEIPKQPEEGVAESLDYNSEETREHLIETREYIPSGYSIDDVDPINEVDNSVEMFQPHEQISLQNDILINKLMSDHAMSGGMVQVPVDVEVFSPDNRDIYAIDDEEFVPKHRDAYESFPYISSRFRPQSEKLMSLT